MGRRIRFWLIRMSESQVPRLTTDSSSADAPKNGRARLRVAKNMISRMYIEISFSSPDRLVNRGRFGGRVYRLNGILVLSENATHERREPTTLFGGNSSQLRRTDLAQATAYARGGRRNIARLNRSARSLGGESNAGDKIVCFQALDYPCPIKGGDELTLGTNVKKLYAPPVLILRRIF